MPHGLQPLPHAGRSEAQTGEIIVSGRRHDPQRAGRVSGSLSEHLRDERERLAPGIEETHVFPDVGVLFGANRKRTGMGQSVPSASLILWSTPS
jgi:hypothetical protein